MDKIDKKRIKHAIIKSKVILAISQPVNYRFSAVLTLDEIRKVSNILSGEEEMYFSKCMATYLQDSIHLHDELRLFLSYEGRDKYRVV